MRILVTGGAGYIGSHAVKMFRTRGHEVWVYDNLTNGHEQAVPQDQLIIGDLADRTLLDQVFQQHSPEAVVHYAAFAQVGESVTNPSLYYHNNLVNTIHLMEAARRHEVQRFVFSSTAAVYGVPEENPITEKAPTRPINPYGNSKLAVEKALGDFSQAYDWGVAILRYFNAAGASPDGDIGEDHTPETHLIPLVIQAALGQRASIKIFGTDYQTLDGTCVRDYIHVDDLAEAHLLALEELQPGKLLTCNLGIGRGYSVREVIESVKAVSGRSFPVEEAGRRPGDPPTLVASSDKVQSELGWQPKYQDLQAIVETAWQWHVNHPDGYQSQPGRKVA